MPIDDLLRVMAMLRDPDSGCPWDLEQDFGSIAPYTVEEAYEVADAIERDDMDDLRDELGDLLLQVVFHSQMAAERELFDFEGVVAAIVDKMIRRHPHVFGQDSVVDSAQQTLQWEQHKQRERQERGVQDRSALAGISVGIPEWQRAVKLQKRAARTGFEWPDVYPVIAKLREELAEVEAELSMNPVSQPRMTEEIGDLLFVAINVARHLHVDPGVALRSANRKFESRFRKMEQMAQDEGVAFGDQDLPAMELWWNRAKAE